MPLWAVTVPAAYNVNIIEVSMKIKAISVPEKNRIEVIESEAPTVANPDDVIVKMKVTGICGSDMHFYHGTLAVAKYPRIIGHEGVGEVIAVGSAVKDFKPGDIVVGEPLGSCGECPNCLKGRPNTCLNFVSRGCHVDGCFREITVFPAKVVHKVPSNISLEEATLIEPYSIAAQACWRGKLEKGDFIWVMGAGPIGLVIADVAANIYGATVIITDLVDSRLEIAKKLGIKHCINASKVQDIEEEVKKITGPYGPQVVADAVCLPKTFEQAVRIASPGGRVISLSFGTEPVSIMPLHITAKELDIVGSRHQTYKFKEVISWFEKKLIHPKELISHVLPYQKVAEGIHLMETDPNHCCKVLLDWRQ